ncbi:TIGR02680 family protein [Allosalinactinospora lopnorensis]|uniref:TIGR02680 family protein n=1 Tax=Allosalinactinospora lopnorensis TaxID=1352348 RepID=UPI000623E5E7|nr:TIGR02680 family protein [Allosalinactinospora lopnorensis]
MSDAGEPETTSLAPVHAQRYRLNRAGICNVWQYDDHTFRFADGRLLLRGRNGTGKSKALEMLLPFLLDGDARRLDTTGTGRTSLRWLLLDGRTAPEPAAAEEPGTDDGEEADEPDTSVLGYLWVEFTLHGEGDEVRWLTLGAAITASPGAEARSVFFVTEQRVGVDLALVTDGRPMPVERLRTEVGASNCYDSAVAYRARVMGDLFGIDDPVRYRNLVHLLYRLRRPTIGERLEAGELVSVLAEALPPMDETVIDAVARNISDLEEARERLSALRAAKGEVETFLADYRRYLHGALYRQAGAVREQIDVYQRRDTEVVRLRGELDRLVTDESAAQEERDRLRRTRDTAASDAGTLDAAGAAPPVATEEEQEARYAAVTAYIRAAEAAWAAGGYALTTEERARQQVAADITAIERALSELQRLHAQADESARAGGVDAGELGQVPQPVPTLLAPRESVTQVDLEGLEQAVEREPVAGIDLTDLRGRLAGLHDRLGGADGRAAGRMKAASELRASAAELVDAERREAALTGEEESADAVLERAREREREAIGDVRAASADYAAQVRDWSATLRDSAPDNDLTHALARLEEQVELPLDEAVRVLDPEVPEKAAWHAHEIVDPLLQELRERRDTAVGEERELATELDELSDRKSTTAEHIAAPPPSWATFDRDDSAGVPFYLAVDFADGLAAAERAGLEAALEASGLLSGWIAADGAVLDPATGDLLLTPGRQATGRTLLDVLAPVDHSASGVTDRSIAALLASVAMLPSPGEEEAGAKHRRDGTALTPKAPSAVGLDGRWRLGVAGGAHHKQAPEYIGEKARTDTRDRHLANIDRRIAIAEALLAEAEERRGDIERRYAALVEVSRRVPSGRDLIGAWAALDNARSWLADAKRGHAAAQDEAAKARSTVLELRSRLRASAEADAGALPTDAGRLTGTITTLERLRVQIASAHRDLEALAVLLGDYQRHVEDWERARSDRILAEDARTSAISDMITVRRQIELTDRARTAAPDQIENAVGEVRGRMESAGGRLPEAERIAQQARDERVAAETRLDAAVFERAEQARRVIAVGAALREMLSDSEGAPDTALLAAAGLTGLAGPEGPMSLPEPGGEDAENADGALAARVRTLDALVTALEDSLDPPGAEAGVDNSGILRRGEELHGLLTGTAARSAPSSDEGASWRNPLGARPELTEPHGIKRVTVYHDDGSHDITEYAEHLDHSIARAEEAALLCEEEAFERHLLGELAGHLSRQIEEARALIASMNDVLANVTTSQGLGVRLDWRLAPDADEDIHAVVPLLERPPEQRTRVETTRLRDALRRCIEAIRRLDPSATGGARLRAALDYRSWFAFTVYVTDAAHPERERRLGHRTALSQGEQRVVAYLVLFAAAAAQFDSLAAHAWYAPRLILLDDAFAKVDEPTHGRLLGLLVELDLDFVLTSERVWGCFPSVPSLHIYECLRDPAAPGIATLHFTWDGNRRRLVGV